jgi:hypothetical protein
MFRGRTLGAFVLVLGLAACGGPLAPPVPPLTQRMPGIQGVDLATDSGDVLGELRTSGLDFVARYYRDPTSRWPALSAAEAQRLSSLGLKIVVVWESHSGTPAYFSYAQGYWDGINAWRDGVSAGQPAGTAIYFAVDYNAGGAQMYQIDQYFRGINSAFAAASRGGPGYRIGVYGSGAVCDWITRSRLAQYSWLSNARAWAGYQNYTSWNIRQHEAFGQLSFNHDADEARGDYGAFTLATYAPATSIPESLPPQPISVATQPAPAAVVTPAVMVMSAPATSPTPAPEPEYGLADLIRSLF